MATTELLDMVTKRTTSNAFLRLVDITTSSYAVDPSTLPSNVTSLLTTDMESVAMFNTSVVCLYNATMNVTNCTNDTTTSPTPDKPHELPHSLWLTIILGFLAGILSLVTVLGNVTVVLAFGLERTIRQPTNYFLASLAVSDLLIGTFSMPLYTQYLLWGKWPLGPWLCDLWLSLDWTVCLTSQYTVFLITMDRFLSVKIPAKYRNWRTEKKVLIMISITWILPALIFFTSVIGWQFFVGKRTVEPHECEVQFMEDPEFTFLLTIGYYWITLVVMCVLYGGIYKVALDLQRKSDAKHKKLQSTMELAGDNPNAAIRSFGGDGEGVSINSSGGGDSQAHSTPHNNIKSKKSTRKSVKAALPCPIGVQNVNTTSFSTSKAVDKDDDRSSSPAFASDDDNSSSGGAVAPGKSPVTSNRPTQPQVNNVYSNTGGLVRSLHGELFTPGSTDKRETQTLLQAPHQLAKHDAKSASDTGSDVEGSHAGGFNNIYSSEASGHHEKQTTPLLQNDINRGCRFIDEKSFLATLSSENAALLSVTTGESEVDDLEIMGLNNSSPIWKRRSSLPPLASDIFELDDNTSDCFTDFTTTTDLPATSKAPQTGYNNKYTNGGEQRPRTDTINTITSVTTAAEAGTDDSTGKKHSHAHDPGIASTVGNNVNYTNAQPSETNTNEDSSRSDTHCLAAIRRRREKDTRIHTFVKSVRSRNSRRRNRRERKSKSENRARKALRTISFILGAFVLCWTPYHVIIMVMAICTDCVDGRLYALCYWLCYLNSPINPFCYAFANAQFKRTFLRIMKFDWHRT